MDEEPAIFGDVEMDDAEDYESSDDGDVDAGELDHQGEDIPSPNSARLDWDYAEPNVQTKRKGSTLKFVVVLGVV